MLTTSPGQTPGPSTITPKSRFWTFVSASGLKILALACACPFDGLTAAAGLASAISASAPAAPRNLFIASSPLDPSGWQESARELGCERAATYHLCLINQNRLRLRSRAWLIRA